MPVFGNRAAALYLITEGRGKGGDRILRGLRAALDGGLKSLQIREKTMNAADLCRLTEEVLGLARGYEATVLVNDRLDVALDVGAHGVHLAVASMDPATIRKLVPPGFVVGASTHSIEEIRRAEAGGADFVTFGPVFDTPSKRPHGPPLGLAALERAAAATALPVLALGGITRDEIPAARKAGGAGVALISAIWQATDMRKETEDFLRLLTVKSGREEL